VKRAAAILVSNVHALLNGSQIFLDRIYRQIMKINLGRTTLEDRTENGYMSRVRKRQLLTRQCRNTDCPKAPAADLSSEKMVPLAERAA